VNAGEPDGTTPLHWAASRNDVQTVSHAYTINWNDGINQIHIIAYDAATPSSNTVAHLVTVVPRADLEALAAATFTEAFAKLNSR